jgi:uncharacterized protein YlxP (DUF503 family)
MFVGVCRFTVIVAGSHSLKEKRVVLRRVKDRVRTQMGITLAEVAGQDTWQRADLAFALVSGERDHAQSGCESVLRQVAGIDGAQVAAARIEVSAYGEDWYAQADLTGRVWEQKAGGGEAEDLSWVPTEWLEGDDHER